MDKDLAATNTAKVLYVKVKISKREEKKEQNRRKKDIAQKNKVNAQVVEKSKVSKV